jgi:hypothetical protein
VAAGAAAANARAETDQQAGERHDAKAGAGFLRLKND